MDTKSIFSKFALPLFDGDNYNLQAIIIDSCIKPLDLWEVVEKDFEISPLQNSSTMAQLKYHKDKKTRKEKAKSYYFFGIS